MKKITFYFSNKQSLCYQLNNTKTASIWLDMMQKVTPNDRSRQEENHRHGFASKTEIKQNIQKLTELCKQIEMPKVNLSENHWLDWQKNLNQVHVGFPRKLKKGGDNRIAHSCNLLIHWLEYELSNLFDDAEQYLFNLDFNHQAHIYNMRQKIPTDEFKYFTTNFQFGFLCLHYIHIGRHFYEMFNAQDFICPQEQFRPQWYFNATSALQFSEARLQTELKDAMKEYYDKRGGESFFRLAFNDPRLAKGFFKLGELENLNEYNLVDRDKMRQSLSQTYITDWIIG